jgi:hypothetical protein
VAPVVTEAGAVVSASQENATVSVTPMMPFTSEGAVVMKTTTLNQDAVPTGTTLKEGASARTAFTSQSSISPPTSLQSAESSPSTKSSGDTTPLPSAPPAKMLEEVKATDAVPLSLTGKTFWDKALQRFKEYHGTSKEQFMVVKLRRADAGKEDASTEERTPAANGNVMDN